MATLRDVRPIDVDGYRFWTWTPASRRRPAVRTSAQRPEYEPDMVDVNHDVRGPNPVLTYRRRRGGKYEWGCSTAYPDAVALVEDHFDAGWSELAVWHGEVGVGRISERTWWAESTAAA